MISYEDIKKANETLKFSDIKGKNYAEVPQRVKAFRMLYPQGFIITEMVSNENGVCVFKASAGYYGENGGAYTLGTGTAYEKEGSSYINKTSYIENCETSAVGRALGFLNIGSDTSIASYEEMQNAINQQEAHEKVETVPASEPIPAWNAGEAFKRYLKRMNIEQNRFLKLRKALIDGGVIKDISLNVMTADEFTDMCKAVEANYPDVLWAKGKIA